MNSGDAIGKFLALQILDEAINVSDSKGYISEQN